MRDIINLLLEAGTDTRDTTQTTFDFMPSLEKGSLTTTKPAAQDAGLTVPGKPAGKKRTKRSVRAANVAPEVGLQAAQHLGQLGNVHDEIDDAEAARRAGHDPFGDVQPEVTTENLPAIISKEMVEGGGRLVNPEWHQVKHLPGYLQSGIRALGRSVFGQFTPTPIEDIQVLTTLGGINPEHDVVQMMQWIRHHGVRDDSANIDFSRIMPGYTADVSLWNTSHYTFLLVHDFGGYYVYGWAGGRGVHLAGQPEMARLR